MKAIIAVFTFLLFAVPVLADPPVINDSGITVLPGGSVSSVSYIITSEPPEVQPVGGQTETLAQVIVVSFIAVADPTMAVIGSVLYAGGWMIDEWTWTSPMFGTYIVFLLVGVLLKKIVSSMDDKTLVIKRRT